MKILYHNDEFKLSKATCFAENKKRERHQRTTSDDDAPVFV